MMHKKLPMFDALTGIRALGAWWIVLFHMQEELVFLVSPDSPLMKFASVGHVGITLFFTLSGFVLAYNYKRKFQTIKWDEYFQFLWQRLARLYPIHLATLFFLLSLVAVAGVAGVQLNQPDRYLPVDFFRQLLLINGWETPIRTTWNGVAWTLSLEWLCYLMFPFLAYVTLHFRKPIATFAALIGILWVAAIGRLAIGMPELLLNPAEFIGYFWSHLEGLIKQPGLFLFGFLVHQLYETQFGERFNWKVLTAIAFGGFVISSLVYPSLEASISTSVDISTLLTAPFMGALIYSLAWERGSVAQLLKTKPMMYWGYTSYALFMTHTIVLLVLRQVIPFEKFAANNVGIGTVLFLVYLLIIAVVARLTYICVEEPSRDWMKSRFKRVSISK